LTPEALAALVRHVWPGNVRELRSALEYAFVVCPGSAIEVAHLPTLRAAGGNKSAAARELGVSRLTVLNRMRKCGVDLRRHRCYPGSRADAAARGTGRPAPPWAGARRGGGAGGRHHPGRSTGAP
jgi:DNA-binding NtrC family response regulator